MSMSLHTVVNEYGKVSRFLINGIFCLEECRFIEKNEQKMHRAVKHSSMFPYLDQP